LRKHLGEGGGVNWRWDGGEGWKSESVKDAAAVS